MPRTSTIPPGLKQLLSQLKHTVATLSECTGIEPARIIQIYQEGKPTLRELFCLVTVLGPALASYLAPALGADLARLVAHSVQIGLFNQGGAYNTQHNVVNNYVNVTVNVNHVVEPQTRAVVHSPQRPALQPMQAGGVVRQLEPVGAGLEVGRAA